MLAEHNFYWYQYYQYYCNPERKNIFVTTDRGALITAITKQTRNISLSFDPLAPFEHRASFLVEYIEWIFSNTPAQKIWFQTRNGGSAGAFTHFAGSVSLKPDLLHDGLADNGSPNIRPEFAGRPLQNIAERKCISFIMNIGFRCWTRRHMTIGKVCMLSWIALEENKAQSRMDECRSVLP